MGCSILARNVQRAAALCLARWLLSEFKGQSFCSLATCSPYPSSGTQTKLDVLNLYTQLLAVRQLFAAVRLPCCLQTGNGRFLADANINLLTRHLNKTRFNTSWANQYFVLQSLACWSVCSKYSPVMWQWCHVQPPLIRGSLECGHMTMSRVKNSIFLPQTFIDGSFAHGCSNSV